MNSEKNYAEAGITRRIGFQREMQKIRAIIVKHLP